MKRASIVFALTCFALGAAVWAQQANTQGRIHASRHQAAHNLTASGTVANRNFTFHADAFAHGTWSLGTYPGGTWAGLSCINDFGVAVGVGDVPPINENGAGETHPLAISLFGPHAGEWVDLGLLSTQAPSGWEEPLVSISNTGLIVGHSISSDGRDHGFAWTAKLGMVDLGTLADIGYTAYNSSWADATNRMGTLIVGWSGIETSCINCAPSLPVVWTPSLERKNGSFVTKWKIHLLDMTGFEQGTNWFAWNVNDSGQIVGEGADPAGDFVGVIWMPQRDGKTWKLQKLPTLDGYPVSEPFNINDRGEVAGDIEPADFSVWLPAYWRPLNPSRKAYSGPVLLGMPEGLSSGYADGINEFGDLTGELWGEAGDEAIHWTMKNPSVPEFIDWGDSGFTFSVNNFGIAALTYSGGDCTGGSTCGGAVYVGSRR